MKTFKHYMEALDHISVPLKKIKDDLDNRKRVKDFTDRYRKSDRPGSDY
tara:strand:+ start:305 stop:451 length:147 start_codon:yes stop_codon:yes gene_type:complete